MPASAFRRGQPAAFAYSIARSTPSRNSLDALRLAGDAAVALGGVARRQVVQHHLDARGARAFGDLLRAAERIGKLVFDVAEAGFRRGREALRKRQLRKQQREVGGESWASG